jgi:hypothetical protein
MYTMVQTAKFNGMNPETYLRDTLTKIAESHPIEGVRFRRRSILETISPSVNSASFWSYRRSL